MKKRKINLKENLKAVNVYAMIYMTAFISFLGFFVENVWGIIRRGTIDNRGMFTPFLLGYGLLIIALYFLIGTPNNMFSMWGVNVKFSRPRKFAVYFLICMVIVMIGEIALGYLVELIAGFEYWNYASLPLNITKYTSIPTTIGFATIMTLFMGFVFDPLYTFLCHFDSTAYKVISVALGSVLIIDFAVSFILMIKNGGVYKLWKITVRKVKSIITLIKPV